MNDHTSVTVVEAPTLGKSSDVTVLMDNGKKLRNGTKRKLAVSCTSLNNGVMGESLKLKPVLKGSLTYAKEKLVWSGCWGLTLNKYEDAFANEVIRAPFYFERTSTLNDENSKQRSNIFQDGYFSGYFCMQTNTNQNGSVALLKHFENDILLRFRTCTSDKDLMEVVGSGENKFGKFLVEGRVNTTSNEINCARNYVAKSLKRKVPGMKPEEPQQIKRSSRVKKPSFKYQELKSQEEIKKKCERKYEDFPGRLDIVSLLESDLETIPAFKRFSNRLESFRVKNLDKAIAELEALIFKLKENDGTNVDRVDKELGQLKVKFNIDVEEISTQDLLMESVLDNYGDLKEIDPLCIDPCATIPLEMKSPPVVDISKAFRRQDIDINMKSFKNVLKVWDEDEPVETNEGFTWSNDSEMDFAELKPIDDVDFSDWTCLDAQTLRELNDYVEFSCPSKGG